ncbi:MAG: TrkH family potassium uptake protein [Rhodospirillales bacterium]|nr:MAG: TrkH family potassium uptake protein [Rhodospirillales bacterium]
MDFRPILFVIGILLTILAAGMCVPALVDAAAGHPDWTVFAVAAAVTLFFGVALVLSCRTPRIRISVRQAFVLTTLSWVAITVFAALPFHFSDLELGYTDAFFEAMSGVTTTGSTVIKDLDTAPPGILLWRALLQWLGGLGIIVMAISVLPMLGVGGMQMFRVEAFETGEKMMPRAAQISAALSIIYLVLTAACAAALWAAGMTFFDAVCHAMTTLATGGFSTRDASVGYYDSASIDAIITVGMIAGGLPFVLYLKTVQGEALAFSADSQVRWYLGFAAISVAVTAALLWVDAGFSGGAAVRYAAFNVISIMTGTGFATDDFWLWGAFAGPIFFYLMFIGGCTGSTSCGIKIFRFQVLWAATVTQFHHLLRPHGVFIPYYNHRPIPGEVITSVLSFFLLYGVCFALLAVGLGMLGLDYTTAISGAATAISNVGPGLGPVIGPAGNFATLPDAAKWLLSVGMLLGRLELFTVLMLLTPALWRG